MEQVVLSSNNLVIKWSASTPCEREFKFVYLNKNFNMYTQNLYATGVAVQVLCAPLILGSHWFNF